MDFSTLAGYTAQVNKADSSSTLLQGISSASSAYSTYTATQDMFKSADLATQGGAIAASGYLQAGDSAVALANYNSQIVGLNLSQQMDILAKNQANVIGTQNQQMSSSGISVNSKSFLQMRASSLNTFSQQALNMRIAAGVQQQGLQYQGQVAQVAGQNKAAAATYQAQIAAQAANQKAEQSSAAGFGQLLSMASTSSGSGGLLGSIGSLFGSSAASGAASEGIMDAGISAIGMMA